MAETQVYNGFVYTRASPDQPWRKTAPAGQGGAVAPNPLKVRGEVLGQSQTAAQTGKTVVDTRRTEALLPYEVQKAQADARKAQADAQQASGLDRQKLANIRATQAQIDRLGTLFKQGPGRTNGFSGLLDFLPTPKNEQFNTAGAGLGETALAAFRVPGVGSQSDTELRAFIEANRPSAADYDAKIQEKMRNLQSRLDQTYQAYGIKRETPKKAGGGGWKIERIED